MYTSVALLALSGFLASAPAIESASWMRDYSAARAEGRSQKKPLAVFLGNGPSGWNQVSRDGQLGKEVRKLLAQHYVCVYVDTTKRAGQRLAADFEMPDGLGLVLSDRTGKLQAFRHEGDLDSDRLADDLRRFADPDLIVRRTETNPSTEEVRYYPAQPVAYYPAEQYAPPVVPVQFSGSGSFGGFGSFGGGGGRGC